LLRDLSREAFLEPSRDIDLHELILFKSRVSRQFTLLADKIGMFGIGLRAYRDILARSHRHSSGHTRQQDIRHTGAGCGLGGAVSRRTVGNESRKTGWMRAEAAGDPGPWRQQALLGRAVGCRRAARHRM
jgi:hypothetical protein